MNVFYFRHNNSNGNYYFLLSGIKNGLILSPLFLLSSEAIGALTDQLSAEKAEQKTV